MGQEKVRVRARGWETERGKVREKVWEKWRKAREKVKLREKVWEKAWARAREKVTSMEREPRFRAAGPTPRRTA